MCVYSFYFVVAKTTKFNSNFFLLLRKAGFSGEYASKFHIISLSICIMPLTVVLALLFDAEQKNKKTNINKKKIV